MAVARIYRVLESGRKFSAADMLALETDIYSDADRYFAERFVYAVDHATAVSAGPNKPPRSCGSGWPDERRLGRAYAGDSRTRRTHAAIAGAEIRSSAG